MPVLAIIDDKKDQRDTIKNYIELEDIGSWEIKADDPLPSLEEYPSWIRENEISVILLDERLNESNAFINYYGHELVDLIREKIPELPIYVITGWKDDEELLARFKQVEAIIERHEFVNKPEEYIPRFMRAAQKFAEAHKDELNVLSEVSKKIVLNKATPNEIATANAIQQKLSLEIDYKEINKRSEILHSLENELEELDKVKNEISNFLKNKDDEMA